MVSDDELLRAQLAALVTDSALLDSTVDGARSRSSAVAALPRAETVRHTVALISSALLAFANRRPLSTSDLAGAARLGAERAEQGVPLAALLDGFQAGRAEAVRTVIARVRAAGVPAERLLDAFVELDGLITDLEHELTHAHHRTELDRVRTARDQRSQVLRQLLLGVTPDEPTLESVGLSAGVRYHCLVSAVHEPAAAHRLEQRLAKAIGGVYGLLSGYLVGVAHRLPASVRGSLVVASQPTTVAGLPDVYRTCCAARDAGALAGLTGLLAPTDLAVDAALDAMPALGLELAGRLLGCLKPATPFHRDLVVTALAQLDNGGRLDATAAVLHVHPNTVKYRLRRMRELTGFTASGQLRHDVHWWWALRTWLRNM